MKLSNKVILTLSLTMFVIATSIVVVTSCSRKRGGGVFFVSGGSVNKSFNQQGVGTVAKILNKNQLDTFYYNVPKGSTVAGLYAGYKVANINKNIVVGTGFLYQDPVKKWVKMEGSKSMKFILTDVTIDKQNDYFKECVVGI